MSAGHASQGRDSRRLRDPFELVAIGETMVQFTAAAEGGFGTVSSATVGIGGAESNVASYLAQLGHAVAWISRVGADPFGTRILADLTNMGVDVRGVIVDVSAPTGVYFKSPRPSGGTDVHYYRSRSAASRMSPTLLSAPDLADAAIIHISGITPALSSSCAELVAEIATNRSGRRAQVSFDVNYRPALWPVASAADHLLKLAQASNLVFVGLDEAQILWGALTAEHVHALVGDSVHLVVKDGGAGATSYAVDGTVTYSPATPVEVVEVVGAGDAFAAGYLHGLLAGLDELDRLRSGHRLAVSALGTYGDVAFL